MVAVLDRPARSRTLPLLTDAQQRRAFAWRDGRLVDVGGFLADVQAVATSLPRGRAAINLCEDRYAFLVAFSALAVRGQSNLLPSARTPAAIAETLAAHADSYTLGESGSGATHCLPPLDSIGRGGIVPMLDAEQLVAIGFTSGSTGQPKANPKRWRAFHGSQARNAATLAATLGLAPDAVAHAVATVPPQHMYGIELSVLLPLLGRFAVHASRPLLPADVAAALADVPEPRVLVTTPIHLRALMADSTPLPRIGAIVSATAPLPQELAAAAEARYGAPLLEMFGSTETCVIAHRRTAIEDAWQLYPDIELRPQPDGTLVEAPYFDAPVALQDLVELLPARRFRLRGRHADLVDIAGKRASLADLTRRVLALPGVEDAAVVQLDQPDRMGVRRIAALVVAPERSESDLLDELRSIVDPAFLPRPLRKLDALPRNGTGKLPRAALLAALAG